MKKVLSVALASAMVLGMGANAFAAIELKNDSNQTSAWPLNYNFGTKMVVLDKDDKVVVDATTNLNTSKAVDFKPGDVIWLPLVADNQVDYGIQGGVPGSLPAFAGASVTEPISSLAGYMSSTDGTTVNFADFGYALNGFVFSNKANTPNQLKINTTNFKYFDKNGAEVSPFIQDKAPVAAQYGTLTVNLTGKAVGTDSVTVTKTSAATNGISVIKLGATGIPVTEIAASTTFTLVGKNVTRSEVDLVAPVLQKYAAMNPAYVGDQMNAILTFLRSAEDGSVTEAEAVAVGWADGTTGADTLVVPNIKVSDATAATWKINPAVTQVKFNLAKFDAVKASDGNIVAIAGTPGTGIVNPTPGYVNTANKTHNGAYTGNIDKNWSINLIDKSTVGGVATELVEKAEFYRSTAGDVAAYGPYMDVMYPNAVYIKVTLKDKLSSTSKGDVKFHVYVANNNGNTSEKTDKYVVSGKLKNDEGKYVDFNWSNNATSPAVWTVRDSESGTAVFDFADKAFLTVKMYSGEKMYLDMSSAFQKGVNAIEGLADAEFDSFIKFDTANANFSRSAELVIASDVKNMFVYQITKDNEFIPMDAEYVTDYKIAHTNSKVNGYKFNTKDLGNFVLSKDEIVTEEEAPAEEAPTETPTTTPETPVEKPAETAKPNPNTGANDFVGVAVALAVVSVAAAGALALKK